MDFFNCSLQFNSNCTKNVLTPDKNIDNSQRSENESCTLQWSPNGFNYTCTIIDQIIKNYYKPPLISNETKRMLELYINVIGFIVTSSVGVFGNVINMAVYRKQGLSDSITLGFFALSVSDLILVVMPLFTGSLYIAKYLWQDSNIDFSSIHYVSFGWVRNFTYSCSLLITAFLSLERCCCIAMPFKVTTLFTRKKTVIFLTAMFSFHAACLCLLPTIVQLQWQDISGDVNSTQKLKVKFSEFGRDLEVFYSTTLSFIVPVGCQVIVTLCAFVMVRGLRKSARFRAEATTVSKDNKYATKNETMIKIKTNSRNENTNDSTTACSENQFKQCDKKLEENSEKLSKPQNQQTALSSRDARLVKTMIFLVSILSACNIPFLAATFAWRVIPDLNIGKPYQNTLSVTFSGVYILGNINAASNVLVYYYTSSRFRQVARELFLSPKK